MTDGSTTSKVNYKDCMAFQQKVYEKIDATEQRTMARMEAMEKALMDKLDGMRGRVYFNAGVVAVLLSLVVGLVTHFFMKGH
jgi:hypothetical protein